jgi:beta-ribofuranosylaminobenzene 5'-phosphate synthase
VYGVTDADSAADGRRAAEAALAETAVDGEVCVVRPRNDGARVVTD